jgi:formate--tetrahydrofolate ligase
VPALGRGLAGIEELANRVAEIAESGAAQFAPLYPDAMPLFEKIETIAKRIYRADEVLADKKIRDQLQAVGGRRAMATCRSAWPRRSIPFRPIRTCAARRPAIRCRCARCGCRPARAFVVAICGEIMTMPGLPKVPAAEAIGLNAAGEIEGLF